jgi:glycosyltransferase involved in cell wall biosynthesis
MGRITVDKGVRELMQAFLEIKAAGSTAHLVFVGRFDLESGVLGEILPFEIKQLPDAHIVGYTECPEDYLAIADILCLPSYREGFGTVVIEAAAMGVPTIGTDIYGLSDAVVDGETGLLVPPRNVEKLTVALMTLIGDRSLREAMGARAKLRAHALFDANAVNQAQVVEYIHLLKCKNLIAEGLEA